MPICVIDKIFTSVAEVEKNGLKLPSNASVAKTSGRVSVSYFFVVSPPLLLEEELVKQEAEILETVEPAEGEEEILAEMAGEESKPEKEN